jgi:hypothetical protein
MGSHNKHVAMKKLLISFLVGVISFFPSLEAAMNVEIDSLVSPKANTVHQEKQTTYTPPALSLERKSLRIINMQGAAGLPKGEWEMFIQHRFGTFGTGAYNWYGLDQSYMRIGLDAGLSERLTVGVSRSSMNKIADGYFKYQFKGKATASPKKEGDSKSEVTAAWYSNVSINTQARASISPEPFYYTNRLRFVNTIIISKNINDRLLIALTPSLVHVNLVDLATESNDIAVMGAYGRMKLSDRYAVTAEIQKPFLSKMPSPSGASKSVNIPTDPYMALGFEIYTAKHVFQLSVSNAQSMNESYYMTQNNGSFEPSNLRFGFNIVRRW